MFRSRETSGFGRGLFVIGVLSSVILGASLFVGGASAGECPADQKRPNAREAVEVGHDGVTDMVIALIDVDNVNKATPSANPSESVKGSSGMGGPRP